MAFLSGSIGFERFRVVGSKIRNFSGEQLELLTHFASGKFKTSAEENVQVGFLGGAHLLDREFNEEKNIINNALHFGVRIDTNQVPSALKRAWLQIELAALMKDNPQGRPTRAQRQEANDAVEQRCQDELKSDKYVRMQQYPALWDARQQLLYFGGSGATAVGHAADLFERAFAVELERVNASWLAMQWAERTKKLDKLHEIDITSFLEESPIVSLAWSSNTADDFSFLGNEFLLWLWWYLDNESDRVLLQDESEVTLMFARTLQLECPWGEWGREVLTSECPIRMPEAMQAIRAGKLPRKAGLILVRDGQQFEFVLQAESFTVSSAKIQIEEPEDHPQDRLDSRIDSIRFLSDTVDQLFEAFCHRRVQKGWSNEVKKIRQWLQSGPQSRKSQPAA
jgi:hypothetical protein